MVANIYCAAASCVPGNATRNQRFDMSPQKGLSAALSGIARVLQVVVTSAAIHSHERTIVAHGHYKHRYQNGEQS
jgi:hypothetical protein